MPCRLLADVTVTGRDSHRRPVRRTARAVLVGASTDECRSQLQEVTARFRRPGLRVRVEERGLLSWITWSPAPPTRRRPAEGV